MCEEIVHVSYYSVVNGQLLVSPCDKHNLVSFWLINSLYISNNTLIESDMDLFHT